CALAYPGILHPLGRGSGNRMGGSRFHSKLKVERSRDATPTAFPARWLGSGASGGDTIILSERPNVARRGRTRTGVWPRPYNSPHHDTCLLHLPEIRERDQCNLR